MLLTFLPHAASRRLAFVASTRSTALRLGSSSSSSSTWTALAGSTSPHRQRQEPSPLDRESMSYSLEDLTMSDRPLPPNALQDDTYGDIPQDYHNLQDDSFFSMADEYDPTIFGGKARSTGTRQQTMQTSASSKGPTELAKDKPPAFDERRTMNTRPQNKTPPSRTTNKTPLTSSTKPIPSSSTVFTGSGPAALSFNQTTTSISSSAGAARAFSTAPAAQVITQPPPQPTAPPPFSVMSLKDDLPWDDDTPPVPPPEPTEPGAFTRALATLKPRDGDVPSDDASSDATTTIPPAAVPVKTNNDASVAALTPPATTTRQPTSPPPSMTQTEAVSQPASQTKQALPQSPVMDTSFSTDTVTSVSSLESGMDTEEQRIMMEHLEDEPMPMEVTVRNRSNLQFAPKSDNKPVALPRRPRGKATAVATVPVQFNKPVPDATVRAASSRAPTGVPPVQQRTAMSSPPFAPKTFTPEENGTGDIHRPSFEMDDEGKDDNVVVQEEYEDWRPPPPAVLEDDMSRPNMHSSFLKTNTVTPPKRRPVKTQTSPQRQEPQSITPSPPAPTPVQTKKQTNEPPKVYEKQTEDLKADMERLQAEIYAENNGVEFKLTSVKQVANVLYGEPDKNNPAADRSTSKDKLDAMASAGVRMADLILQYRVTKRELDKRKKNEKLESKGTVVKSALETKPTSVGDKAPDVYELAKAQDPLLLVDASHLIFQSYFAYPPMHRQDGTPVGAVLGFCTQLNNLIVYPFHEHKTDEEKLSPRVVLCFDSKEKQSFRRDIFPEYKAHRPDVAEDLIPQFDLVRKAADAYGLCQIEAPGYEADDVIATLATWASEQGIHTNIISRDKDLMQLIKDGSDDKGAIYMVDNKNRELIGSEQVRAKHGVDPSALGDLLALMGDKSDNIPGVRGIGPKTAAKLLNEHQSLDAMLNDPDMIKAKKARETLVKHAEDARLSRELVELVRDVPVEDFRFKVGDSLNTTMTTNEPMHIQGLDDFIDLIRMEEVNHDRILDLYDSMNFRTIKKMFEHRMMGAAKPKRSKSSFQRKTTEVPKPEDYADVPF